MSTITQTVRMTTIEKNIATIRRGGGNPTACLLRAPTETPYLNEENVLTCFL
jgi:hypothetical protein